MTEFGDKSCFEQSNGSLPIAHIYILSGYKRISSEAKNVEAQKEKPRINLCIEEKIGCIAGMNCGIMFNRIALTELCDTGFPLASSEFNSELFGLYLENPMEVIYDENAHWR